MAATAVKRDRVEALVRQIVRRIADQADSGNTGKNHVGKPELRVSISARHVHLTDAHVETLFGPGHTLDAR